MKCDYKALGLAAAVALAPMVASAATVDINFESFGSVGDVGGPDFAGAIAAQDAFMGSSPIIGMEDFSTFTACTGSNSGSCASSLAGTSDPIVSSAVGDFSGLAPDNQPGGSALAPDNSIIVRSDGLATSFSRYNVVGPNFNWLDSNDLHGIRWEIPGTSSLSKILKIAFFMTDVDDVGNLDFAFTANGAEITDQTISGVPVVSGRPNGELQLVTMLFNTPVNLINIEMASGPGDGFGVDGIQVGTVPLPASALLLLGGLGGLGGLSALRRRKPTA
jgi:hypothetical protein